MVHLVALPKLDPGFGSDTGIQGRSLPESPDLANHLARVKCGAQKGDSPTDLKSVAQVTTVDWRKTNCDAAVSESSSCNPDGLKDWQFFRGESYGTNKPA